MQDYQPKGRSSMNLDAIFNMSKVKFAKLDVLFDDVEIREIISSLNIFINIESIYHKFHNKYVEEQILVMKKPELKDMVVNVIGNTINLAAHYRLYFRKNKIKTNIVFYMNEFSKYSQQNNAMHVDGYREKYVHNYTKNSSYENINMVMKTALNGIDKIVEYIEGVYFITSDRIESSLIPYLMSKEKMTDGQLDIIVTTDPYDLQYANKNFVVIYPRGDESRIISEKNLFDVFRDSGDLSIDKPLPTYLYPFILAVIGDKRRGINKVKGVGLNTIYRTLLKLYDKLGLDEDEYLRFEQLAVAIKEDPENPSGNRERVINNYMAIDLDRQLAMVSPSQTKHVSGQLKDHYDDISLKTINREWMSSCPINLVELNQYHKKEKSLF